MSDWLIFANGKVVGPLEEAVVVRAIADGKVPRGARVRRATNADTEWFGIDEVEDFADAFEATIVRPMAPGESEDFEATVLRGPIAPEAAAPGGAASIAAPVSSGAGTERDAEGEAVWMLLVDDELRGPVSLVEVRRLIGVAEVPSSVMLRRLKTSAWKPASSVLGEIDAARPRVDPPRSTMVATGSGSGVITGVRPLTSSTRRLLLAGGVALSALTAILVLVAMSSSSAEKNEAKTLASAGSKRSLPSVATDASAKAAPPAVKRLAADVFREHPESAIPYEAINEGRWLSRISNYGRKGAGSDACPAYKVEGADEFERKMSRDKADAVCSTEITTAVRHLAACPAIGRIPVEVRDYDFATKAFPIDFGSTKSVLVSNAHQLFFESNALLSWPSLGTAEARPREYDLCEVNSYQARDIYSHARLLASVPDEASAKAARAVMPNALEIAFVLDGKPQTAAFACGLSLVEPEPGGHVLAWRMEPSFGWATVDIDWIPPGGCEEARKFFGVVPIAAAPSASASASAVTSAPMPKTRYVTTVCPDGRWALGSSGSVPCLCHNPDDVTSRGDPFAPTPAGKCEVVGSDGSNCKWKCE